MVSCSYITEKPTTPESINCEIGKRCKKSGKLNLYLGGLGSVGVLESRNNCIALALPESIYRKKEQWNNKNVVVTGKTYIQEYAEGVVSYQLLDRFVKVGDCDSSIIIYVDNIKPLK